MKLKIKYQRQAEKQTAILHERESEEVLLLVTWCKDGHMV